MYAIHFIEANKIQYNIPEWQKYNFFQVCMPVTNKVLKISQNDFTFWLLAIIYFGILICKAYMVQSSQCYSMSKLLNIAHFNSQKTNVGHFVQSKLY